MILEALVTEVRRLARQVVEAMYVPVEKRVWRRLDDMTLIFGSESERAAAIPITQDVLAQLSGCTRPTANRVLRNGEEAGIIAMARGRIEILDLASLQRRAR
ncbi:MAG: family transcriptional regulator, cyclic receptor protein [Actinomycetota bacterium]|nr:family transcriptional regulator, cyclic receptor protein [Actinomycetota bacterium]